MSQKGKNSTFQGSWLASVSIASMLTIGNISVLADEIDVAQENVKKMLYQSENGYIISTTKDVNAFLIKNGSLGGEQDKTGKVILKASAPNSKLEHITEGHSLIGKSNKQRAQQFIVEVATEGKVDLIGDIFAARLQLSQGSINANANIDVGAGGETKSGLKGPVQLALSSDQPLKPRVVDLGKLQAVDSLVINAQGNLSLTADMRNSTKGMVLNLFEGETTKSGNWKGDIQFMGTSSELILADNYKLEGNIKGDSRELGRTPGQITANNAIVKGDIGTEVTPLNTLMVNEDSVFQVEGDAYFTGATKLYDKSKLIIKGDYQTSHLHTLGNDIEILFNNTKRVKCTSNFDAATMHSSEVPIEKLTVAGADVELSGNKELLVNKIVFTQASTLTLPKDTALNGKNIANESPSGQVPTIRVSGANHTITREQVIGKANSLINIALTDDKLITVQSNNFYAALKPDGNHIGTVNFQADPEYPVLGNKMRVYGLGDKDKQLKEVNIDNDTTNYGDTYVDITNVRKTYIAAGTIAGIVKLDQSGQLILKYGVELVGNIYNANDLRSPNPVVFEGKSKILGNIGQENNPMAAVNFTDRQAEQTLRGSIYADTTNFNDNDITLLKHDDNTAATINISGTSNIDGIINLGINKLVLNETNWGPNTIINTTLSDHKQLGSIEVKTRLNIIDPNQDLPLLVKDDLPLPDSDKPEEYILINKNIENNIDLILTGQSYTKWSYTKEDNKVILLRENNAKQVVKRDTHTAGGDATDLQNTQNLVSASGGDALTLVTDIGKIADAKTRGEEVVKNTSGSVEALVRLHQTNVTTSHSVMLGRLHEVTRPDMASIVVGAGDEGLPKANIGAWVIPIYSHANKTQKHISSPAYAVKTLGGIGGVDVAPNDNLTLGAAISVIKSNLKYKNLKVGDKINTNTIMLSVYGARKLTDKLFLEGVASCGSTQIAKGERRKFSFGEQIAKANYESIAYGGEVLMGYNAVFNNSVLLTPVAGVSYIKSRDDSYTETGTTFSNKTIAACSSSRADGIIGMRVLSSMNMKSNMIIVPEAHAMLSHYVGGKAGKFIATLKGAPEAFSRVNDTVKTIYNLGVSITSKSNNIEYGVGYDAHLANKYAAHQGSLKVRLNF